MERIDFDLGEKNTVESFTAAMPMHKERSTEVLVISWFNLRAD